MHSPTNCYLVSLAAADCVVLIASVPNEILSYYVIGSQWIWGPIGCAVFVFLQNLGRQNNKIETKNLIQHIQGPR
jgi:thyrotropin-releasing hormone receptor